MCTTRNVRKNGDWNCPKPTGMAAAFPQSTSNTKQPVRLGEGKAKPPCTCTEIWRHVYTVGQKEPTRSSCVGTWVSSWEGAEQHPKERTHFGKHTEDTWERRWWFQQALLSQAAVLCVLSAEPYLSWVLVGISSSSYRWVAELAASILGHFCIVLNWIIPSLSSSFFFLSLIKLLLRKVILCISG